MLLSDKQTDTGENIFLGGGNKGSVVQQAAREATTICPAPASRPLTF